MLHQSWRWALTLLILAAVLFTGGMGVYAQHPPSEHDDAHESAIAHEHPGGHAASGWEGSAEGIAYSEFNHHLAGLCTLLLGLAELGLALRAQSPVWTRLVLPGALAVVGLFLLVWSDHEAWPIGSLSFAETFFGQDHEILQHKLYGILAVAVATGEILRRLGRVTHPAWALPLPLFAVIGGLMLFAHSHGAHPAAHKIAIHHAIMGTMAVGAGGSKSIAAWLGASSERSVKGWELAWAGLIILIGLQLLVYSE
jgi:putative copper resistance protein D